MNTPASLSNQNAADPTVPGRRLYYLDWLRVIAVLGVVIFHAVHPFDTVDWQIKNSQQSMLITVILLFFNFWGMHLFFLLSGAGSWFSLRRRTPRRYASERVRRLLLPFIFGTIIFSPIMLYFTWQHKAPQMTASEYLINFLRDEVLHFGPDVVKIGFHLWFVGFLFAFSILALPVFRWLNKVSISRVIANLARFSERRGGVLLFALPIVLLRLTLQPFFPVENSWADFLVYFCYFLIGYIFYMDDRFQKAIRRDWLISLGGGIVSFLFLLLLLATGDPFTWSATPSLLQYYILWTLIMIDGWCWVLFLLGLGIRKLDFTSASLEYCQQAIMPVFLLHQPVIIAIAFYIVQLQASIMVKLPFVVFGSLAVTLGLYELVIRHLGFFRLLFGMKLEAP